MNEIKITDQMKKKFEEDSYLLIQDKIFAEADFNNLKKYISAFCQAVPEPVRHKNFTNNPKLIPRIADLVTAPPLVSIVEKFLGPDLVFWSFGICYKPANSDYRVPAHTDSHYWLDWNLLEPNEVLGVFIPLTDISADNGCLRVLPGINVPKMYQHQDVDREKNFFLKEIVDSNVDLNKMVDLEMKANQICLLKENLIHSSECNKSSKARIAITLRYISGSTKYNPHPQDNHKMYLIKGENKSNNPSLSPFSQLEKLGGYSWSP